KLWGSVTKFAKEYPKFVGEAKQAKKTYDTLREAIDTAREAADRKENDEPENQDDSGFSDCRRQGIGWSDPGPLDTAHGNRATGIRACLDKAWIAEDRGTDTDTKKVAPPGYQWAVANAAHHLAGLGPHPGYRRNACHLLGKQLGGDGLEPKNLATCSRAANDYVNGLGDADNNKRMTTYEAKVKEAVTKGNQVVYYQVTPIYSGDRTVPYKFVMTARGITADGLPGLKMDEEIPNTMYSWRHDVLYNIGLAFKDGQPVPVGNTP
ncbi:DNA/RNA non-specific endonuclease, partial [Streptomyces sp. NPDC002215]|uniref:DNA/RNA non-specific endonuclease n=1 Tax=Streptomyces sp. NPDC002215 TaxID=3154412 RepID=UPI003316CC49